MTDRLPRPGHPRAGLPRPGHPRAGLPRPGHPRAGGLRLLGSLVAAALVLPLLPVTADAQEGDGDVSSTRIGGQDRFETASRIATDTFDDATVAVLVTGRDFPDALAGSFAAGRLVGPLLLVEPDDVPVSTLQTLETLGVESVVLLGGTGVIGHEVAEILQDQGYAWRRIAGDNRYHTAAEVAVGYGGLVGEVDGDRTAILATGADFPDALAAGPLAARANLPLLLTPPTRTMPVVDDALANLEIERILVLGGTGAVSPAVAKAYQDKGYTVERLAGRNRQETAAVVADAAIDRLGFSDRVVLLARGNDFPDALTASIHGARLGAPIVLTGTPDVVGSDTDAWLVARCPDIDEIRALGGTGAVSAAALGAAVDAAERCTRTDQEVGRFTTPLPHNPDRTHNIHLAADYIDGDVIASGATYSLNNGIGPRTHARGFREVRNGCISGGQAVDCVGGGVSQMATTFMNVAWFTGIGIPQFRQHSIYFTRYPVCHEATLSGDRLDVQVHNNSPYDIVVDAFYTNDFIGVRYLSRQWAHVESWSEPAQPPSSGGFNSRCGRTITYPDGTAHSESYAWTYDRTGF